MKKTFLSFILIFAVFALGNFTFTEDPCSLKKDMMGATVIEIPYFASGFVCNGEFVTVEGTWKITTHVHSDGNGGFHVVENWNIKATGTGDLGNEYRLNYSDNFVTNIGSDGFPFTNTRPVNFNLVGMGDAPNLKFQGVFHTTINNNGEVTASFGGLTTTCK